LNLSGLTQFLVELKFDNSKFWFDAHRKRYESLRGEFIAFMEEVIAGVSSFDPSVAEVKAKDTLFRIVRDVRFAHDKSPYKTSFSAAISPGGRHATWPLYYVQVGADESFVAGGVYFPQALELSHIRAYIERYPEKAHALLTDSSLQAQFGGLGQEGKLQRFPRGFGEGSELLKFKSFTVSANFDAPDVGDLTRFVVEKCEAMGPLHAWLREALSYRAD